MNHQLPMKYLAIIIIAIMLSPFCLLHAQLQEQTSLAVEKAVNYLQKQDYSFDYVYLYAYLQQQYPEVLTEKLNHPIQSNPSEGSAEVFFHKLLDKSYCLSKADIQHILEMSGTDAMTLKALYCNQFDLDQNYLRILKEEAEIGNYQASHALLAMIWLKKYGCAETLDLLSIEKILIEANWINIQEAEDWTDLKVECLALLQANGEKIEEELIESLLKEQNSDGGFPMKPDTIKSHTHTTILAIWALLPSCQKAK